MSITGTKKCCKRGQLLLCPHRYLNKTVSIDKTQFNTFMLKIMEIVVKLAKTQKSIESMLYIAYCTML